MVARWYMPLGVRAGTWFRGPMVVCSSVRGRRRYVVMVVMFPGPMVVVMVVVVVIDVVMVLFIELPAPGDWGGLMGAVSCCRVCARQELWVHVVRPLREQRPALRARFCVNVY